MASNDSQLVEQGESQNHSSPILGRSVDQILPSTGLAVFGSLGTVSGPLSCPLVSDKGYSKMARRESIANEVLDERILG
jgi:hypothetical protein